MKLPFTTEEFLNVFKNYNQAVWPLKVVFYLLAGTAVAFGVKKTKWSDKFIACILFFFWLWMGIVYHLVFFVVINKAAYWFGAIFILQGWLFLYFGVFRKKLTFQFLVDASGITGLVFIVFALLIYPVTGYILNYIYP